MSRWLALGCLGLVACQVSEPAMGWASLDTLSLPGLTAVWGEPSHTDTLAPSGAPLRTLYAGNREAVWWPDGRVHRLTWGTYPVNSRKALANVMGVPQEWIRYRPDSMVAVVSRPDSGILMVALDNGDKTWNMTWTALPRPLPPPESPTALWLRSDSLESPAAPTRPDRSQ